MTKIFTYKFFCSIILFLIIFFILLFFITKTYNLENFHNFNFNNFENLNINNNILNESNILLSDTYPTINKNELSNENSTDIWREYPIYQLGSYQQITNNIKYPNNPDNGTCTPPSMCNALYYNNNFEDNNFGDNNFGDNNFDKSQQQIIDYNKLRIGSFFTDNQLVTSLPFTTKLQNILY